MEQVGAANFCIDENKLECDPIESATFPAKVHKIVVGDKRWKFTVDFLCERAHVASCTPRTIPLII